MASRRGPGPDGSGEVAAAGSEDGAHADARRRRAARTPAGRRCLSGDDADPAGAHDVGEAQPDAADDRGAAVRAHDQQPATWASSLRRTSWSTETLSLKSITSAPACSASMASDERVLPGHRHHGEVGAAALQGAARGVRRDRVDGAAGALARGEQLLQPRQRRRQRAVVVGADRDEQVVRARPRRRLEAEAGEQVEVQRRGHRDQCRLDSGQPLRAWDICISATESR